MLVSEKSDCLDEAGPNSDMAFKTEPPMASDSPTGWGCWLTYFLAMSAGWESVEADGCGLLLILLRTFMHWMR